MILVIGGCSDNRMTNTDVPEVAVPAVVPESIDQYIELQKDSYFAGDEYHQVILPEGRSAFVVRFDVQRDVDPVEIDEHAVYYIESMKKEHKGLVMLSLYYYESELFFKSDDQEIYFFNYSVYGRVEEVLDLELGDFSKHGISSTYYPSHPEHQLTEEELRLYDVLQTYMIEQTGEPLSGIYDVEAEYKEYCEMICYEHVAEQQGVTVMDILELRNKESLQHRENALQLTDEEVALYDILKSYAMEEMGEPLGPVYNLDWYGGAYDILACYEQVAEEQGVSVMELLELRNKAFLWREEELFTDNWIE